MVYFNHYINEQSVIVEHLERLYSISMFAALLSVATV